jgi:hypothetical protein
MVILQVPRTKIKHSVKNHLGQTRTLKALLRNLFVATALSLGLPAAAILIGTGCDDVSNLPSPPQQSGQDPTKDDFIMLSAVKIQSFFDRFYYNSMCEASTPIKELNNFGDDPNARKEIFFKELAKVILEGTYDLRNDRKLRTEIFRGFDLKISNSAAVPLEEEHQELIIDWTAALLAHHRNKAKVITLLKALLSPEETKGREEAIKLISGSLGEIPDAIIIEAKERPSVQNLATLAKELVRSSKVSSLRAMLSLPHGSSRRLAFDSYCSDPAQTSTEPSFDKRREKQEIRRFLWDYPQVLDEIPLRDIRRVDIFEIIELIRLTNSKLVQVDVPSQIFRGEYKNCSITLARKVRSRPKISVDNNYLSPIKIRNVDMTSKNGKTVITCELYATEDADTGTRTITIDTGREKIAHRLEVVRYGVEIDFPEIIYKGRSTPLTIKTNLPTNGMPEISCRMRYFAKSSQEVIRQDCGGFIHVDPLTKSSADDAEDTIFKTSVRAANDCLPEDRYDLTIKIGDHTERKSFRVRSFSSILSRIQ